LSTLFAFQLKKEQENFERRRGGKRAGHLKSGRRGEGSGMRTTCRRKRVAGGGSKAFPMGSGRSQKRDKVDVFPKSGVGGLSKSTSKTWKNPQKGGEGNDVVL